MRDPRHWPGGACARTLPSSVSEAFAVKPVWLIAPPIVACLAALSALNLAAAPLEQAQPAAPTPTPKPAPAEDRVGYPEGYRSTYQPFFVMARPDNKQRRVRYARDRAPAAR